MTSIAARFEAFIQWIEVHCVHPEIIANREMRAYNRLLFYMCLGVGGTRIVMLLVMWGLTGDERYAWNALQLHILTYAGVILKFTPSIYRSALGLLVLGHLRYYYAFCLVDDPLVSEALSALCIPIVAYYLAGRRAAVYSTIFVAVTLTVFLNQGNSFDLTHSFEPFYFDLISVVWAIVGAGFVASTYQHQRSKYHLELQRQVEEMQYLLEQNHRLMQTKQHFIAVSSHEIRNPLSVVLGRLELEQPRALWLNPLEASLHATKNELSTIMSKIKQTVQLDPIQLMVQGSTFGEVMDVVIAQLRPKSVQFVIHHKAAVCVGIPAYRLTYVLLKILQMNSFTNPHEPLHITYDQRTHAIELECFDTMEMPSQAQLAALLLTINGDTTQFDIVKQGSSRLILKWKKESQSLPNMDFRKKFMSA
ncbi:MAG: hypothetical protein VXZ96_12985 [Myxococcota bacterium]|nr:hypothetical protein [Myxococcota bacterium]